MPPSRTTPLLLRAAAFVAASVGALVVPGCSKDASSGDGTTFRVAADEDGFKPSSVTLKKGAPATLVFTRKTEQTCATEVVFPELGIEKDLPRGVPVSIVVPTDEVRTLTFQCGMGMYKSAVVIAE